jgi:TrmH family RNA methyltransferase
MVPKKITSLQHSFVKYIVSLRKEREFRRAEGKIFVMGIKMVEELIHSKTPIHTLIVREDTDISASAQETILVTEDILKKMTGLKQPEPVAAVVSLPSFQNLSNVSRLLVLDGVSDPGNVGTVIRSALALGWDGVYLLESTCDPFNEKALRAAKGATFRLPLAEGTWSDFLSMLKKSSFTVLVADIAGSDIKQGAPNTPLALILSRESQGARKEATELFQKITIPMSGEMESLNVASAGAILLYELGGVKK